MTLISALSDNPRNQRFKKPPMTEPYVCKEYPLSEQTGRIIGAAKAFRARLGPAFEEVDFVQTLSYLKAPGYAVARLLNLSAKQLQIKRIVNERPR